MPNNTEIHRFKAYDHKTMALTVETETTDASNTSFEYNK